MRYFRFLKDTTLYFVNYILSIAIVRVFKLFKIRWKNNIWVIGGNGGHYYSDNSAELHKYILEKYPEIEVYWIIDKRSPDIFKAKSKGPILFKHSLKGNIFVLLAKVLICNHSIRGDLFRGNMKLFKSSFTISLCHGITAFKAKKTFVNTRKLDMLVATSEYEKEIKLVWMDNKEERVVVTGFPRYDNLFKHRRKYIESKNIFYMPTWRPWIVKKWVDPSEKDFQRFRESTFFVEIDKFLGDVELNNRLKESNYKLNIFFHKNLHVFIDEFFKGSYPSNIKILAKETDVQEELLRSDLLITDYSSVAWDFLYLDRPVLFYQFDYKTYKKYHSSYIKMPEDLFGPVTSNYRETIEQLQNIINGKQQSYQYKRNKMKNKFIKYDDGKNCERIMRYIIANIK